MDRRLIEEIFARSGAPLVISNPDGTIRHVNRSLCRLLARPASELVGRRLAELVHPDDTVLEALLDESDVPEPVEKRYVRPDGSVVWVEVRAQLVRDELDVPRYVLRYITDVTARRDAERLAAARLAQQEALVALGRRALHEADEDDLLEEVVHVLHAHLPAERAVVLDLSSDPEEAVTRAAVGVAVEDDPAGRFPLPRSELEELEQQLAQPLVVDRPPHLLNRIEARLPRAGFRSWAARAIRVDGRLWGLLGVASTDESAFESHDVVFLETVADLLGAALAGARHREATMRAVLQGRMASLGLVAAGIAHEVGNALAVVKSRAQLLAAVGSDEAAVREQASIIDGEVDHIVALVDRMLDLARPHDVRPRRVDVVQLVRSLVPVLEHLLPPGVRLAFVHEAEREIWVDPNALHQILLNLVDNAGGAVAAGGSVTVALAADDGGVRLTVTDTGVGMAPDVAASAFEPFFTTKGELGTGLGLAQVRSLVEQHGGEVVLETRPGAGTRVSVWFPSPLHLPSVARPARDRGG